MVPKTAEVTDDTAAPSGLWALFPGTWTPSLTPERIGAAWRDGEVSQTERTGTCQVRESFTDVWGLMIKTVQENDGHTRRADSEFVI